MQTRLLLFFLAGISPQLFSQALQSSQSQNDTVAIRTVIANYINGWYAGDTLRVEGAIHPSFSKRIIGWSRIVENNNNVLSEVNFYQLLDGTRQGIGKRVPSSERTYSVFILDLYNNSANIKIDCYNHIEYALLAKWNGAWKIFNILWEMKPQE